MDLTRLSTARVLVTGGAGYIGSHAVRALLRAGAAVDVLDSLLTGHRAAVDAGARLFVGDVRDRARIERIAVNKYDAVMHFAGLALVGESVREPARYADVNVVGTRTVAEVAAAHGTRAFVFSSSCATYGAVPSPIDESAVQAPLNPYGQSKLDAERVLLAMSGLRCALLRYFNAAGADEVGDLGEDHATETHLVPLAIGAAAGRRPALTVFGDDWPTRDGTCVRDYVHVVDLVDAHLRAVIRLLDGAPSEAFNLGTGRGSTVREVIEAVGRTVGPVPHVVGPRRPGDPAELFAAGRRASEVLGWRPQRDLDRVIIDAWRWHRRHPRGFDADDSESSVKS